jgi:hypothetical protein
MKTSELTGAALDWAVAKCEGIDVWAGAATDRTRHTETQVPPAVYLCDDGDVFEPSTNWAQGGPILQREKIRLDDLPDNGIRAFIRVKGKPTFITDCWNEGITPLIAAMRCYVASKLGDEVEIPIELK